MTHNTWAEPDQKEMCGCGVRGTSPVPVESGKHTSVQQRHACVKPLRNVLYQFAWQSTFQESWAEAIYALLKRYAELLSKVLPDQKVPPPLLYDPEVHRRHRQGQYRPLKSLPLPNIVTQLQSPSAE